MLKLASYFRRLGIAEFAAAILILFTSSTHAGLIFESDAANGFSTRMVNSSIMTRFEVSSDTTINQIGIEMDLNSNGDLNFVIFNSLNGALLYQSGAKSFIDDGMGFKVSDSFSFTLETGNRYALGAMASVGSVQNYVVPGGKTVGDITSLGGNQNADGFLNPSLNLGLAGTDARVRLWGATAQVSEPATLALLGIGLAGLGVFRRRKPAA